MLRLTNDGVSIHGSEVEWAAATHGCIGVPTKFAALLFAQAKLGDRVIITNGKMLLDGQLPAA
jgi:lipoprotein-anchoring transpeptidase ErfK/SrfK